MGHPEIDNRTPFAFEPLFVSNEAGRPIFAPVLKATYSIGNGGELVLSERQLPVNLAGERCSDPAEVSSYRYEPETAWTKPMTDVVLVGNAQAPKGFVRELEVTFAVGRMQKSAIVLGDRTWVKRIGGKIAITDPEPFESMPITYERAFGGWDRSDTDQRNHTFEPRNPVGAGFRTKSSSFRDDIRLPNIEDPARRLKSPGDTVTPTGFGFVSPDWAPRAALAGTYDDAWMRDRMPLLPRDFDLRFFNAASAGLVSEKPLQGGEPVLLRNLTRAGDLTFRLPSIPAPSCRVARSRRGDETRTMRLDTVIVNSEDRLLLLLWRTDSAIEAMPDDVRAVVVTVEGVPIHIN
jgi:hypothetical protein